ncbi:glycosyltransferase [Aureococcus anophagefferens]|nr:glycosyltransferase [Aureococcus anophagefferens]
MVSHGTATQLRVYWAGSVFFCSIGAICLVLVGRSIASRTESPLSAQGTLLNTVLPVLLGDALFVFSRGPAPGKPSSRTRRRRYLPYHVFNLYTDGGGNERGAVCAASGFLGILASTLGLCGAAAMAYAPWRAIRDAAACRRHWGDPVSALPSLITWSGAAGLTAWFHYDTRRKIGDHGTEAESPRRAVRDASRLGLGIFLGILAFWGPIIATIVCHLLGVRTPVGLEFAAGLVAKMKPPFDAYLLMRLKALRDSFFVRALVARLRRISRTLGAAAPRLGKLMPRRPSDRRRASATKADCEAAVELPESSLCDTLGPSSPPRASRPGAATSARSRPRASRPGTATSARSRPRAARPGTATAQGRGARGDGPGRAVAWDDGGDHPEEHGVGHVLEHRTSSRRSMLLAGSAPSAISPRNVFASVGDGADSDDDDGGPAPAYASPRRAEPT